MPKTNSVPVIQLTADDTAALIAARREVKIRNDRLRRLREKVASLSYKLRDAGFATDTLRARLAHVEADRTALDNLHRTVVADLLDVRSRERRAQQTIARQDRIITALSVIAGIAIGFAGWLA